MGCLLMDVSKDSWEISSCRRLSGCDFYELWKNYGNFKLNCWFKYVMEMNELRQEEREIGWWIGGHCGCNLWAVIKFLRLCSTFCQIFKVEFNY